MVARPRNQLQLLKPAVETHGGPTQDAKDRNQIGQTLRGPELRFLGLAARFEDLVRLAAAVLTSAPEHDDQADKRGAIE